ncbi:winged helix-turn-helix domain-containing protein, partial [Candidatus Neomarinimicrobiota bacterium]
MIPKYEEIMLPLLQYLSDQKEHGLSETHDALAKQFKLTDDEIRTLLPSGKQAVFRNRVAW